MTPTPLQYEISDWTQAAKCLSNTSKHLHIHVSSFIHNPVLTGTRIKVVHDMYGDLFTCIVNGRGELIDSDPKYEMSTDAILSQLAKFGFCITYPDMRRITTAQIDYLITLNQLHFDKIRVLNVWAPDKTGIKEFKHHIVAFQSANNASWLNNDYSPSYAEFTRALADGSAVNLDGISETSRFVWDWLTYVANISDILADCSEVGQWP